MIRALAVSIAALLCLTAPALAGDKRVYKVDSVIATWKGNTLSVQANGAVSSGGWKNARLQIVRKDARSVTLEFVALPPPADMVVIQSLVPVTASLEIRAASKVTSVNTLAEANELTSQVLR
ncbi:MAG: hypothetical protein BGN82_09235 [Alphaproteobacteria bacterium 65-7]|nr:MAG: hypothetical protein BGN82_09235 [Alphaproteobacteria bacterium 65-7]